MLFEEDLEVDSTTVFKQAATNLTKVKTLDGTLERFGYSKDDRINRRELVLMFTSVEREMEDEIHRLAKTAAYDEAKEMRARLNSLRAEFDQLQTNGVATSQREQKELFDKAREELLDQRRTQHEMQAKQVDERCRNMKSDQEAFHAIERENLEICIARIERPPIKYSKRLIELLKAEHELIKLQQYEDARKVRRMIDRLLPGEEEAFNSAFERSMQAKRDKLLARQRREQLQLEEKMKAISWTDTRAREKEMNTQLQRITNHSRDMMHSHSGESKLRPEMSVKPSALWQKRKGYESTAASLRGHQLLGAVRGKREDEKVFVDTLVDKHNFIRPLQDTITLHQGTGSFSNSASFS